MKKTLTILFTLFVAIQSVFATKIPPEVKKCVAFIFVRDAKGHLEPYGTGFFVSVRAKDSLDFGYFVTAKHVLQDGHSQYLSEIYLRLNRKDGGSDTIAVQLFKQTAPIFFTDKDQSVDLAVIPITMDRTRYDQLYIPASMITTKDLFQKEKIQEGDDVFFTGMFTPDLGERQNLPIVRFGRVALISDEPVMWDGVPTSLYLIETFSFGGNSGSPLFFYLDGTRDPSSIVIGPPTILLAGIVKGYFGEPSQAGLVDTGNKVVWPFENSGVAAVIPAYQLQQLLNSPALVRIRNQAK